MRLLLFFAIMVAFNVFLYLAYSTGKTAGEASGRERERDHRADPSAYPKGSCQAFITECLKKPNGYPGVSIRHDPTEVVCRTTSDIRLP